MFTRGEKGYRRGHVFKEMAQTFPNMIKDINLQIQLQWTPGNDVTQTQLWNNNTQMIGRGVRGRKHSSVWDGWGAEKFNKR